MEQIIYVATVKNSEGNSEQVFMDPRSAVAFKKSVLADGGFCRVISYFVADDARIPVEEVGAEYV